MSDFIKSQAEVRANLIGQMREVIDAAEAEKRGLSAEDNQKIERIEADIEARDAAISTAQKVAEREARAIEAASEFTPVATADSNENDVIRALASGAKRSHEFAREDRAALVPGANTVGTSFYDQVFQVAALVGPMLTTSEVFRTNSGENLVIPTVTALSSSASTSAGSAISESNPTFSSITLGATKYAALVSVSNELLSDAGFDISTYIATQLGTSLGIATNTALTTTLNSAAGSVVTGGTGVAGVATYENIVDLVYGIAAGARVLPGLGFMASRTGIAGMRKLKDTAGTYIWSDMKTVIAGQPATLLGYPVYENPDVAATGVGNKSILFGHLPSFKVRVAGGIQVAQSSDYAFNTDVTTFRGIIRVDGNLTHATHIGYFKGGAS
jgi:HK97 family phage major capsid protein